MSANQQHPQDQPGAEFLDDFYAECDEHLTTIRESLVALESSLDTGQADTETIQKLFRAFHSVKGNSGIIGLHEAEELAHSTEDYLRELGRGSAKLSAGAMDLLSSASQALEQVIAASRTAQSPPDYSKLRKDLAEALKASETTGPKPAGSSDPISVAQAQGLTLWAFTFSPTKELDVEGVNINSIRTQLTRAGEILKATPDIKPGGLVSFTFIVGLTEAPTDVEKWERQGVTVAPFEFSISPGKALSSSASESPIPSALVAPSHVLRVDLNRLDELMRITGELVIQRARLEDQISRAAAGAAALDPQSLQEVSVSMGRALREMRECVMRARLVTVAEIFSRMPFVVRDLARETGKKVRLAISGQQTEIDKYLVERLKDPLLHLVRNSISHGIELPEEREAARKPSEATIFLKATAQADTVLIEVGDDGRGINLEQVQTRARELGFPSEGVENPATLLALLCAPGFSTRETADRAAGRGVGMAAVQNVVNELGGTLSLETIAGQGVNFRLRLPLTLAIADVFIVSVGEESCAVPQSFVQEIVLGAQESIRLVNQTEFIPYQGGILPLLRLSQLFQLETLPRQNFPVMVISSEAGSIGLAVDRIHGQREVVVRPLQDPLVQAATVAGATELGDGRPVLLLNAASLAAGAGRFQERTGNSRASSPPLPIAV